MLWVICSKDFVCRDKISGCDDYILFGILIGRDLLKLKVYLPYLKRCLLSVSHCLIVLWGEFRDFNFANISWSVVCPTMSSPVANALCELVQNNLLHRFVKDPAWKNGLLLLDLVLMNHPDFVVGVGTICPSLIIMLSHYNHRVGCY